MKNNNFLQAAKFTLFSLSAGIIPIGTFAIFNDVLNWKWWPAYLLSLVLSVLWNFTLNRKFTFQSASNVPVAMFKVFLFYLVFTPLTTLSGNYLTSSLHWNDYLVTGLNMALNLITEFFYDKYIVFTDVLKKE